MINLTPGDVVVVCDRRATSKYDSLVGVAQHRIDQQARNLTFGTVQEATNNEVTLVDAEGQPIQTRSDKIVWKGPYPEFPGAPEGRTHAFIELMVNSKNPPYLFYVETTDQGIAYVVLLGDLIEPAQGDEFHGFEPRARQLGNVIVEEYLRRLEAPSPINLAPRQLILASGLSARVEDGRAILMAAEVVVLMERVDFGAIAEIFPQDFCRGAEILRFWKGRRCLGHAGELEHELELAFARTEPNEALVYVEDSNPAGLYVLGSTGITFCECDAIQDYLESSCPDAGLWVACDAKWWTSTSYEGERDAGIDCDWRPATADDIQKFGFTELSLFKEVIDTAELQVTDEDSEVAASGWIADQIAAAGKAHQTETERIKLHTDTLALAVASRT